MAKCTACGDTGVIDTGNNDLPCDCPAGSTALFTNCNVAGPVTGAEVKRHFLNGSPEPLQAEGRDRLPVSAIPGRVARPALSVTQILRFTHCAECETLLAKGPVTVHERCKSCGARPKTYVQYTCVRCEGDLQRNGGEGKWICSACGHTYE